MYGATSEVWWISTSSVQTTAQPPSALTPRMCGERGRVAVAHAVAVRHLVEAVAGGHRPDLHRLEEDVESWFSHAAQPVVAWRGFAGRSLRGSTNGIAAVSAAHRPVLGVDVDRLSPGSASSIGTQT